MKLTLLTCYLLLVACYSCSLALAKPEVIEIKSEERKAKEAQAEALARQIDLAKVEDPDTRLALQAMLGMMGIEKEEVKPQGKVLA